MTTPCSLEMHHDSARRVVVHRSMLCFHVLPFDKAAEFEHLSAQFAPRLAIAVALGAGQGVLVQAGTRQMHSLSYAAT